MTKKNKIVTTTQEPSQVPHDSFNIELSTPLQPEPDYITEDAVVLNIERTEESMRSGVFVDEDDLKELTELTADEKVDLARCEATIKRTKTAFYEFALALEEIKRGRLYRAKFTSFTQYCQEVHGLGRSYAYRQAAAGKFLREKSPVGDNLPDNERAIRELIQNANVAKKTNPPVDSEGNEPVSVEFDQDEEASTPTSSTPTSLVDLHQMALKAYHIHADNTRRKELSDLLLKLKTGLQAWAQSEEPVIEEAA